MKKESKIQKKKKPIKSKRAFTLIEMIAVIIIIGIIAIIAVPAVTEYIGGAKDTTYLSYEHSMEEAAKNQILNCLSGNDDQCVIPDKNEKETVYLSDLINEGYIDEMKNPDSNNFCESSISYVEIENTGRSDYEYTACLYCGEYKTDKAVCTTYTLDGDEPVCGEITGASTTWTNDRRTVAVKCSDATSGCTRSVFSKTFNSTTREGDVTIVDRSGRTKACRVNVYVDKTNPTCEIEVSGDFIENVGWYSLRAETELKNWQDADSGVLTYGIGKSLVNRDYNKNTKLEVGAGITTVIGYVKDTAGNEGVCSTDVRVGTEVPKFNMYYGYQLYPTVTNDGTNYTLNGITASGTSLKTTSNTPTITFSDIAKYGNINKVVINLSSAARYTTIAEIKEGSASLATGIITAGSKTVEFNLDGNTHSNLTIVLGGINGETYNISRIDVLTTNGSTYTNKDVKVYIYPQDEGMKTTEASFDGGTTWGAEFTKVYSGNTSAIANTRNAINMKSNDKNINITGIDKVVPTASIVAKTKTSGTTVSSGNWSNEGLNFTITQGTVGLSGAKIYYCMDTTNSCTPTTEVASGRVITAHNNQEGIFYMRYRIVSNAGAQSEIYSYKGQTDTVGPTCGSWSGESTSWTASNRTISVGCNDGNSGCSPATYSTTISSGTTSTKSISFTIKDAAGNTATCSKTANVYVDKTAPTCGSWSGESTSWTASDRTISVGCNDTGSGCDGTYSTLINSGATSTKSISFTIKDKVGNSATCSKTANVYVDKTNPSCTATKVASTQGTTGGVTVNMTCSDTGSGCKVTSDQKTGQKSTVSWTVEDKVGHTATCSATITAQTQSRTRSCSAANRCTAAGCETWKNCAHSECGVNQYKNCANSACGVNLYKRCTAAGCETWKNCAHSECGVNAYKSCATSGCGVNQYKNCANSACGVAAYNRCASAGCAAYNTCANSACGVAAYNSCADSACGVGRYKYCANSACGKTYSGKCRCVAYNNYTTKSFSGRSSCPGSSGCKSICGGSSSTMGGAQLSCSGKNKSCRTKGCGVDYYNTCATAACGVAAYNSCATSGCGCATYNRGSACGVESYNTCRTSGCGVESYKTCANAACGVASYKTCRTSGCGCETYKRASSCGVESYNTCRTSGCGVESYKTCRTSGCGCETYNANVGTCGCATWGAYGAWTNATSCTANTSNTSQTNTECRTIYS